MSLFRPYVCDCLINGEIKENVEVIEENKKSIWVRLEDGSIIKRNKKKHRCGTVKFVFVEDSKYKRSLDDWRRTDDRK